MVAGRAHDRRHISNFDLDYSGNYLDRNVEASFDYSDYSYFYDAYYTRVFRRPVLRQRRRSDLAGRRYYNDDGYTKQSHELRITSPQDKRVRGLLGFFWQEQKHDFWQSFLVEGLADVMLTDPGGHHVRCSRTSST